MLGLSETNTPALTKLLDIVGNFFIMFFAQLIFLAYGQAQITGRFPETFEIYLMALTAMATTLIFFGINQARKPATTPTTEPTPA